MSKLSNALKACINAPNARPGVTPAPNRICEVYGSIHHEALEKNVGLQPWLAIAAWIDGYYNDNELTRVSLDTARVCNKGRANQSVIAEVQKSKKPSQEASIYIAEFMREVGLKCISFNGIARVINCLGGFRDSLPRNTRGALSTVPLRKPDSRNFDSVKMQGRMLWDSIYRPFDEALFEKLSKSHPDLPYHIIYSHYGPLLANPPEQSSSPTKVGRVLTSLVAVACLRSQTGVGQQVTSHIFGLRKAYEDGTHAGKGETVVEGGKWLASDEGSIWMLGCVDSITDRIRTTDLTLEQRPKL